MLPRHARLLTIHPFSPQTQMKTPFFTLKVKKNTEGARRFGFVVSKRVDKRAVVRNRTKRLLRACIEQSFSTIRPGYDMLFILKQPIEDSQKGIVCEILENQLQNNNLLKKNEVNN